MKGAPAAHVEDAIGARDPFPGTYGFAGELPDGTLVRDVLGRHPLFYDPETGATADTPHEIETAESFPAGHAWTRTGGLERVFELPSVNPVQDHVEALDAIDAAIRESFASIDTTGLAIAFSGGLDSALVADFLDAPLYVVGYEGSADISAARESAEAMERLDDLTVHEVSLADIEAAIPAVARAIGRTNAMDVQIALPLYLVASRAAADGFERLALGQGADELFGGYAKVANAPDDHRVEADTVRGARREVLETLPDQLERDVLALRSAGVEPVTPLLYDAVVAAALDLPGALLVDEGVRKVALRTVAANRLPARVAYRDKKAIQYGSLVAREVDRLARQAGFKRRMDDHVKQYVESRLDD